jgi:hypothetical protein
MRVELQRSCEEAADGGEGDERTVAMLTAHQGQAKSMAAVTCSVVEEGGGCASSILAAGGEQRGVFTCGLSHSMHDWQRRNV